MPIDLSSSQAGGFPATSSERGTALTICTVSYESGHLLAHNVPLVRRLNPGAEISWLVAENSPAGSDARVRSSLGVDVRPGVEVPQVRYQAASYHHGAALNELLPGIATRHVLIMDPDLFVVAPDWIERCRRFVLEQDLAFFGAPWHPRWIMKPRGFPSPHFLWIDGARVDVAALDLLPDSEVAPWEQVFAVKGIRRRADRLASRVVSDWMERRKVGRSRDTGCRVHQRFSAEARYECLLPYYSRERHRPGGPGSRISRVADRVLPTGLRLVPDQGTYSERGFASCGLPDVDALGWEEFMWTGQPFAFHVRGYPLRAKGRQAPDLAAEAAGVLARIVG